jgi:hypothetical protein
MLVCMVHDGGLQSPVEAFHESVGCGVMSGCLGKVNATEHGHGVENGFRPACEAVGCSEAVCIACWRWKRSDEIYVDVKKTGCRQREISHRSNCVAGDFGALTGLASPCPGAAIFMYDGPHKTLCDELLCCFGAWVQQIVNGLEHLEP